MWNTCTNAISWLLLLTLCTTTRAFPVVKLMTYPSIAHQKTHTSLSLLRKKERFFPLRGDGKATSLVVVSPSADGAIPFDSQNPSSSSGIHNETAIGVQSTKEENGVPSPASATRTTTTVTTAPTYREIFIFMSTTVLIWLSEPLLSLVDTTVVGLTQGGAAVTQLASLGPATTLLDSLLYLTYFLSIATTNQIAASRAVGDVRQLQRTTSQTLGVATVLGSLTTATVWVWGRSWLTSMAGASAATSGLVDYATSYACIRAAAAVPAVVGMVAQSVCLSTLDTKTPAIAVAVASVLNIVGDGLLAPTLGVRGAAFATAASNVASTAVLLRAVQKQMRKWRQQEVASTAPNQTTTPAPIPLISWPDQKSLLDLLKLVGPIFFVICAKIACYSAMTLRCTDFGVLPLAAHGIMMRLWFFFGCFGDGLSQTAQSFLPGSLYPTPRPQQFRTLLVRLLVFAVGVGLMNSQLSNAILQFGGSLFTNDSAILALMRDHRHYIGLGLLLHPLIMCLEGTVIAARDFSTLVATYAVTLGLHFGILKWFSPDFSAVWRTFFLFQSIRLVNFAIHVWQKQRGNVKRERADAAAVTG